jgi:hypothetical protein
MLNYHLIVKCEHKTAHKQSVANQANRCWYLNPTHDIREAKSLGRVTGDLK